MNQVNLIEVIKGLERNEFLLHYQPKVNFIKGNIIGAEALVRWNRDGELVPPNDFIPICESTGFISVLTERVIELLWGDMQEMKAKGVCGDMHFAINISGEDINNNYFGDVIDRHPFDLSRIQLELTETILSDMNEAAIKRMHEFVERGVSLALDDYGVGFSSLSSLAVFPFSLLKVDKSLTDKITTNTKSDQIVSANIRMAHRIGLRVVAEGIEDKDTYNRLLLNGCDQGQGYYMSRPLPLDKFCELVLSGKHWNGNPVGVIFGAQFDHLGFRKSILELFYYKGDSSIDRNAFRRKAENYKECNLGKWYYGDGRDYSYLPEYTAIEIPHKNFHAICANLVDAIDRNSEEAASLMRQMNIMSSVIIGLLQDLESAVYQALSVDDDIKLLSK